MRYNPETEEIEKVVVPNPEEIAKDKTFDLENLRYAPVLGNLAAAIKNTFTKPDYKYADRLD
jgi:hypothetical protein